MIRAVNELNPYIKKEFLVGGVPVKKISGFLRKVARCVSLHFELLPVVTPSIEAIANVFSLWNYLVQAPHLAENIQHLTEKNKIKTQKEWAALALSVSSMVMILVWVLPKIDRMNRAIAQAWTGKVFKSSARMKRLDTLAYRLFWAQKLGSIALFYKYGNGDDKKKATAKSQQVACGLIAIAIDSIYKTRTVVYLSALQSGLVLYIHSVKHFSQRKDLPYSVESSGSL